MSRPAPIPDHPGLYLIPLDQALSGFTSFISAWLYRGEKTVLVDPGPAATIPQLIRVLKDLSVDHLDAILLTHIHIDHAGGTGDAVRHFTDTPVVCHKSAVKHLTDPTRLWEGSLKTLGATARAYGPIRPVPPDLIVDTEHYLESEILSMATPGHAPHHVSYLVDSVLFAGEAGGVFHRLNGDRYYLRPATPPRFFLETSIRSIDQLTAVPSKVICYGHFGMAEDAPRMLKTHREQLLQWADVISRERRMGPTADILERCMVRLLAEDALMAGWHEMSPVVQERERVFIRNSLRGFLGYFDDLGPSKKTSPPSPAGFREKLER